MTHELGDFPRSTVTSTLTVDLAREVVARVAPEENDIFDAAATTWRDGVAAGKAPGSTVGFGIETALVSEVVLQIVAGSIVEVLHVGVTASRSRWRRWRERRRPSTLAADLPADVPTVNGRIAMTADQAHRLREVSRRHAITFGLSEARADLLADSVVGAVWVTDRPRVDHDDA